MSRGDSALAGHFISSWQGGGRAEADPSETSDTIKIGALWVIGLCVLNRSTYRKKSVAPYRYKMIELILGINGMTLIHPGSLAFLRVLFYLSSYRNVSERDEDSLFLASLSLSTTLRLK